MTAQPAVRHRSDEPKGAKPSPPDRLRQLRSASLHGKKPIFVSAHTLTLRETAYEPRGEPSTRGLRFECAPARVKQHEHRLFRTLEATIAGRPRPNPLVHSRG